MNDTETKCIYTISSTYMQTMYCTVCREVCMLLACVELTPLSFGPGIRKHTPGERALTSQTYLTASVTNPTDLRQKGRDLKVGISGDLSQLHA